MNIAEMNEREVNEKLVEIRSKLQGDLTVIPTEELAAMNTEVDALNQRSAEIQTAIKKREDELERALNFGKTVEVPPKKEERKMEKYEVNSVEYRELWARNLQGKLTDEEKRAYATGDTHTAIPTLVSDKFFEKMKKLAPMLSEITLMRVAGNLKFMVEGTRNAAVAHTENTAVSPAADTVLSVTLGGFEFMKVIRISANAANMSVEGFINWLVEMLGGDIARAIDNYIINDSTNGIAAITYTTSTNQILQTATTGYGYADILALAALLPAAYDAEAKFLVSKKVLYTKINSILDSSSRPIFDPTSKTLIGYPVVVDDYVGTAKNELYLGKWSDIVGNLSQDVTVERSNESGFLNNSIDFRGVAVFDSKPAKIDAIVRLVTTTS